MTGPAENRSGWTRWAAGMAGLALAALWIYWPVLRGGWIWDDGLEVAHNSAIQSAAGWWRVWVDPRGMDYFPLKDTFQWAQWRLWAGMVPGYHLTSVLLHGLGGALIWRVLVKRGMAQGWAWLAALLFVAHPAAVESVAWISEQKNLLALIGVLGSWWSWLDYEETGRRRYYAISLLAFLAALLCKTTVVMFPIFLMVEPAFAKPTAGKPNELPQDSAGRREVQGSGKLQAFCIRVWARTRSATQPVWLHLLLAAIFGGITLWFQHTRAIGIRGVLPPLFSRLSSAGWSLLAYCREAVLPVHLMPVYPARPVDGWSVLPWIILFGAVIALVRWPSWLGLAFAWFGLNLLPVLGLIPMSYLRVAPRADHFLYLSLPAATAALALAVKRVVPNALGVEPRPGPNAVRPGAGLAKTGTTRSTILSACVAVIVAALFALRSRAYTQVFQSEHALWTAAATLNPSSWFANNNLGKVLLDEGDASGAARRLETAVRLQPDSAEAHANLGNADWALGQGPAALTEYRVAIAADPGFAGAHYDLGRALLASGDSTGAALQLSEAVRLNPGYAVAHNNLGLALSRLRQPTEAMNEYRLALQLDPGLPEAHLNLGNALLRAGQAEAAVTQYQTALRLNPNYAAAHRNLAAAYSQLGRREDAQRELRQAP